MAVAHFKDVDVAGVSLDNIIKIVKRQTKITINRDDLSRMVHSYDNCYFFVNRSGFVSYSSYEYVEEEKYSGGIGPRLMGFRCTKNVIGGKIL